MMILTRAFGKGMSRLFVVFVTLGFFSCAAEVKSGKGDRSGRFSGNIEYGNFSDKVFIDIEMDSGRFAVYFSSLQQNANRIPLQVVEVSEDSISFRLQSDFYTYSFRNKWEEHNRKLVGVLTVDTLAVTYTLEKELTSNKSNSQSEEVRFESEGLKIYGTIWYPEHKLRGGIVMLTSSGNGDRSASRAEAMLYAQMGYAVFHYDKRGTGSSEGDWHSATMEQLILDDIQAIDFFSEKTGIPQTHIGIKGSSQGAVKIPYILEKMNTLKFGIAVSCPGVSLLESDLNYWRNRNAELIGADIEEAAGLQRRVYEFIAGKITRSALERSIDRHRTRSWFQHIWLPFLEEVRTDEKLLYSPIGYFRKAGQPILILQGTKDEIIPPNSYKLIAQALQEAGNQNFKTVLLEKASHTMHDLGDSDFPYWPSLHPDYLSTIRAWLDSITGPQYTF